jgi:hypothetical protein
MVIFLTKEFMARLIQMCPMRSLAWLNWHWNLNKLSLRTPEDGKRQHLKALFLKGYVYGKLVTRMLMDGGAEDHVWFEDRWMVASLCDEWLTTLCGLILG